MIDKQPHKYQIELDDEVPDSIFSKKPAKRSDRRSPPPLWWPVISMALWVLMGIGLVYTYRDIKGQIVQLLASGDQKAETIAEELQSKFSSLSLKVASLEDGITRLDKAIDEQHATVSKQITPLEQNLATLQTDLKATRGALDAVKTETEEKTKGLSAVITDMKALEASIKPLENSVKDFRTAVTAEMKRTTDEVKSVRSDLADMATDIKPMKGIEAQVQKQYAIFEGNLKKEETRSSQELDKAVAKITGQLQVLKQQLADLEQQQLKSALKRITAPPETAEPNKGQASPSKPSPSSGTQRSTPPKEGEVIERNIDR